MHEAGGLSPLATTMQTYATDYATEGNPPRMTICRDYDANKHYTCDPKEMHKELLAASKASTWDDAKLEWTIEKAVLEPDWSNCLCGHGIKQKCYLRNTETGALNFVGSSCVRQFMHLDAPNAMFQSIRRVRQAPERRLHARVLDMAFEAGVITEEDRTRYKSGERKEINLRILADQVEPPPKRQRTEKRVHQVNLHDYFWSKEAGGRGK